MSGVLIEARGLRKRYGRTLALDGVDLELPPGRIVGLIGPNGAGKTTLIKALLGLTSCEGTLRVLGLDPHRQRSRLMREVGYIADVAVLPRWARVRELVRYVEGVHPRFSRPRCEEHLARTRIRPEQRVRELSKGMIVQLHLALILAIDARLLVLDEPTLGLDILFRRQFYEDLIAGFFAPERSILVTTHQVEEVEPILTDALLIREGRIVLATEMEAIRRRFRELVVDSGRLEEARALGPLAERRLPSGLALLFRDVPEERLAALGEPRRPSLAEVFVALMRESPP